MNRKHQGFTLIEIMIVIVILGVLAGMIVPNILDRPDQARVTKAKSDIRNLKSVLKLYKLDHFDYPSSDQGLNALVKPPVTEGIQTKSYIESLPKDPWGKNYHYLNPGQHGEIDIFTYGKDGRPGGDSYNADLGSWNLNE